MGVYFRFEEKDILWTVVNTSPRVVLASGTNGWHGNTGVSSSLSLYEGIRARTDVYGGSPSGISIYPLDPMDTHSIDRVVYVSGSYPSTGSVHFVKARLSPVPDAIGAASLVTADDWYQEHFSPVQNLFDYYSRYSPEYFTGSYDLYSLFFWQNLPQTASYVAFSGSILTQLTGNFTCDIQAKPVSVTGSNDFVLQCQRGRFKFYITGSTGQLAFTDFASVVTSSSPVTAGVWQNLVVSVGGGSASFYVNDVAAGQVAYTGTLTTPTASSEFLTVGAELAASQSFIVSSNGFKGFLFDSRVWASTQTISQVSGTWNRTYFSSGSDPTLVHYARFNDGPLGHAHGFVSGSGAFDYGYGQTRHGQFVNFNANLPLSPTWQPVDSSYWIGTKTRINDQVQMFRIVHVPSMFYGRQIATGSVQMVCNAYLNKGIQRVLMDDGLGRLYVSGSMLRTVSGEDYTGGKWNKVGNVFYNEGLIVITDPSMLDFGTTNLDPKTGVTDTLQVAFSGLERVTNRVFQCRVGAAEANGSNNPTFSYVNNDPSSQFYGKNVIRQSPPVTWISAVGLYNEDRKLVAVAKLASPIRKREKDKLLIRLRMDI